MNSALITDLYQQTTKIFLLKLHKKRINNKCKPPEINELEHIVLSRFSIERLLKLAMEEANEAI